MEIDPATMKFYEIFVPGHLSELMQVVQENKRFAYYTSADTALKIIQNEELWFRNASAMNDFSEISHGIELVKAAYNGPLGEQFRNAINAIHEKTSDEVETLFNNWEEDWEFESYIACISLHDETEDKGGRLSMWRAYGNVAMVVNNTPMTAITNLLGVYSLPVRYICEKDYLLIFEEVTNTIIKERDYLKKLNKQTLVAYIHKMFFHTAIGTKHPGFSEEKEWRLYYRPTEQSSEVMKKRTEVIRGDPQIVYSLPLKDEPNKGLHGADIPNLLNRIIVGPTEYPYNSSRAFQEALKENGVEDYATKVVVSDIPLRTR